MDTTIIILSILILIFLSSIWYFTTIHYKGYNKRIERIEKNVDNLNENFYYLKSYINSVEDMSVSLKDLIKTHTDSQSKINKSTIMIIKEFVKNRNKLAYDINTLMNNQKEMYKEFLLITKNKGK